MQSQIKDSRFADIRLPEFERPKFEMPDVNLSDIEMPKVDVGKALTGVATAVGLVKPRRSRWPFVLGAGVVVAAAGLVIMNSAAVRERLGRARAWIGEQVAAMSAGRRDDSVAFTAAETKPIEPAREVGDFGTPADDYPEGFGAATEKVPTYSGSATTPR